MLKLSIMSEVELGHLFGDLDAYIPLHEELLAQLAKATGLDGTVGHIGHIVLNWVGAHEADLIKALPVSSSIVLVFCSFFFFFTILVVFVFQVAEAECLQGLLQQPASSQGPTGPEEAGCPCTGLPAALPGVSFQQEAGPVELPGHPPLSPCQVPPSPTRDLATHAA